MISMVSLKSFSQLEQFGLDLSGVDGKVLLIKLQPSLIEKMKRYMMGEVVSFNTRTAIKDH
jgi:hypothetical protein